MVNGNGIKLNADKMFASLDNPSQSKYNVWTWVYMSRGRGGGGVYYLE